MPPRPRAPRRRRERAAKARRGGTVHPRLEARDDPEVAAAPAAQRPEQVRVAARVDPAQPPVGRDHHEADDVVGGQPAARARRGRSRRRARARRTRRSGRSRRDRAAAARERVGGPRSACARADRAPAAAVDAIPAAPGCRRRRPRRASSSPQGMSARARRDADVVAVRPAQQRLNVAAVARLDHGVGPRAVEAQSCRPRRARRKPPSRGADRAAHPPGELAQRARPAPPARGARRDPAGVAGRHASASAAPSRANAPAPSTSSRRVRRSMLRVAGGQVPWRRRAARRQGPTRARTAARRRARTGPPRVEQLELAELAKQREHGVVEREQAGAEALDAVLARPRGEAPQQRAANAPVLPVVDDGDRRLGDLGPGRSRM